MKSFKDLSISFVIVLVVIFIIEFIYANQRAKEQETNEINKTKRELDILVDERVKKYIDERDKKKFSGENLFKSSMTGFIRGALMGALINGLEGAATGGIIFAIINPIMVGFETHL